MKIAGRTYLDLAKLRNVGVEHLPEVVLAARMYHLAHTHRALIVTGQCALWAHGYVSDPALPPITVASSSTGHPIVLPAVTIGTHTFAPMRVMPQHARRLPEAIDAGGLLIESPESAQITAARTSRNRRAAFTQMCMNAHACTRFDNFHMKASRDNEDAWKFFLGARAETAGQPGAGTFAGAVDHHPRGCRMRLPRRGAAALRAVRCWTHRRPHASRGVDPWAPLLHRLRFPG